MHPVLSTPFSLMFALLLSSCGGNAPASDPASIADTSQETTRENQTFTPDGHWRLRGTVGRYPVFMDLQLTTLPDTFYQGYYYYEKFREPIAVVGAVDASGQLELEEYLHWTGSATGVFRGSWGREGAYTGQWVNAATEDSLAFTLTYDLSGGAVAFQRFFFTDSLTLDVGPEDKWQAFVSQEWLWPRLLRDSAREAFLAGAIMAAMAGDKAAVRNSRPEAAFDDYKRRFFDFARAEAASMGEDAISPPDYQRSASMELIYNDGRWLTFGYAGYEYTGGAHGNYGAALVTYDLERRRSLELQDVFKPGYEAVVGEALARALRAAYGLADDEPLSNVIFEDTIAPNDNFGIAGKGLVFNYVPYEIASYADGEIRLFVPFSEIEAVLQPGLQ